MLEAASRGVPLFRTRMCLGDIRRHLILMHENKRSRVLIAVESIDVHLSLRRAIMSGALPKLSESGEEDRLFVVHPWRIHPT